MFFKLIAHSLKMFRRSELFGKSLFVIILMGFFIFFVLTQLSLAGRILPSVLQEHFPDRQPAEWVYGLLLPIILMDLWMRMFFQNTAANKVKPYLHLPVSRSVLTTYWIFKSWLHPFNLYLLVFFRSFIRMTINPESGSHELGLLAIFLLVAFNQGVLLWIKSLPGKITGHAVVLLVSLMLLWVYNQYTDDVITLSTNLFVKFAEGNTLTIAIWALVPVLVHFAVFISGHKSFYSIFEQGGTEKAVAGSNRLEKLIASVPGVGSYWLLEWQLASRNQRSKWNFFLMIPYAFGFILFFILYGNHGTGTYVILFFLMAGSYGGFHLQHAFAWESHFYDFLATRNISTFHFIRAKYLFYVAYATIQLLMVVPVLAWIDPGIIIFYIALYLYACGFGFFFYLYTGVGNSTRLDANGRSSFNMEGVTGVKFVQVLILFLSLVPFFLLGMLLPTQHGPAILLGITGLLFLATHTLWIKSISNRFLKKKYIKLNLYRQK